MNKSNLFKSIKKLLLVIIACLFTASCSNHLQDKKSLITNDPFEKYNRKIHQFNKTIDTVSLLPASQIYGNTVPKQFRLSAASFYNNLQEPKRFANHIVQGQFKRASIDFRRFILNSTIGLLGLFDTASWLNFFPEETNFDETFAYWSIHSGPYVEIPFLGPSSLRGSFGLFLDYTVNPLLMLSGPAPSLSFASLEIINIINARYEYTEAIDTLLYQSSDSYSSSRLTYYQKSKSRGQKQEELAFELFDPSEEF